MSYDPGLRDVQPSLPPSVFSSSGEVARGWEGSKSDLIKLQQGQKGLWSASQTMVPSAGSTKICSFMGDWRRLNKIHYKQVSVFFFNFTLE